MANKVIKSQTSGSLAAGPDEAKGNEIKSLCDSSISQNVKKTAEWDLCWIPTDQLILEMVKRLQLETDVLMGMLYAMRWKSE